MSLWNKLKDFGTGSRWYTGHKNDTLLMVGDEVCAFDDDLDF